MIQFRSIRWRNFISTGNVFTEVRLDQNQSTLIIGENGAGKSTILDALTFALYGKPFRNINKGQLINSINQKNLEVVVEFTIGSKQYVVRRGIKPSVFEIFCDGQLLNQNAEAREYQEMFEKNILKLNSKSFNQIVILGSASFTPFMQLPAAHRREIIEDLLDIQIFSKMNTLLKDRVASNKEKIVDAQYTIQSLNDKIKLHQEHLDQLKQNNDLLVEQKNQQIKTLQEQLQALNDTLAGLQTDQQEQETKSVANLKITKKLEKYKALRSQIEDKIKRVEHDIQFFHDNDNCPTCKQQIDTSFKTQTTEEKRQCLTEIETGLEKLDLEIETTNKLLDNDVADNLAQTKTKISNTRVEIKIKQSLVGQINAEISTLSVKTDQIVGGEQNVTQMQTDLQKKQTELQHAQGYKQLLDVAGMMLKDTGIKTKIIKQYIPVMNKLINKYLAAMDFFVNFEINESFEETIKSRFRDEFTYASFSEGEKMRIDLALLFTWRSIAKLRNSVSTNLLVMDEVFDSSLDSAGTEEFLKILSNLTKDTNTFIISHKGDQLIDKFVNIIKFEKHNNFSRIAK